MAHLFSGVLFAGLAGLFSIGVAALVVWKHRLNHGRIPRFRV